MSDLSTDFAAPAIFTATVSSGRSYLSLGCRTRRVEEAGKRKGARCDEGGRDAVGDRRGARPACRGEHESRDFHGAEHASGADRRGRC